MTQNHYYDLFIKDLTVSTCIGVNEDEQGAPQRLVITIHMLAHDECTHSNDQLARVVCYNSVVEDMHQLLARRRSAWLAGDIGGGDDGSYFAR